MARRNQNPRRLAASGAQNFAAGSTYVPSELVINASPRFKFGARVGAVADSESRFASLIEPGDLRGWADARVVMPSGSGYNFRAP